MGPRRRRRWGDHDTRSWWTTDHGGMPGWAIVGSILILLGIGAMVAWHYLGS